MIQTMKHRLWCWCLVLVFIQKCIGNRYLIPSTLRNSPVGIGIQSALSSKSNADTFDWTTRRTSHTPAPQQQRQQRQRQDEEQQQVRLVSTVQPKDQQKRPTATFARRQRSTRHDEKIKDLDWDDSDDEKENEWSSSSSDIRPTGSHQSLAFQSMTRGGGTAAAAAAASAASTVNDSPPRRPLVFWESMVSGAISRSMAQSVMHPANTMKTMLQSSRRGTPGAPTVLTLLSPKMYKRLTRGAGASFVLSVPHGAVNFAVLEFVRFRLNNFVQSVPALAERAETMGPGLDFLSSAISTICCSAVSTPQMMVTDNIMAGNYPNLFAAVNGLYSDSGIAGFYRGWWPGLAGKIPSYALTWTLFQQLKKFRDRVTHNRPATNVENSFMGCVASGTTVCVMMPLDTIKTRLVTQISSKAATSIPYKGIVDCAIRMAREEGIKSFYQGIAPRLVSVVPMIGIQFGVYEFMKNVMLNRDTPKMLVVTKPKTRTTTRGKQPRTSAPTGMSMSQRKVAGMEGSAQQALEIAAMETAASPEQPYPVPHFLKKSVNNNQGGTAMKK